jgi:hypothetical protein
MSTLAFDATHPVASNGLRKKTSVCDPRHRRFDPAARPCALEGHGLRAVE